MNVNILSIPFIGFDIYLQLQWLLNSLPFNSLYWVPISSTLSISFSLNSFQFPLLGSLGHPHLQNCIGLATFNSLYWVPDKFGPVLEEAKLSIPFIGFFECQG